MPTKAPPAAKPTKSIFDPFNSSATGHQRADNRLSGSTSWRESRSLKLQQQFTSGAGGGKRVSDTVGAGSLDFGQDGRTENGGWVKGARGLRTGGQRSIWESMGGIRKSEAGERSAKRMKVVEEESKPTSVVNPWTPFRREDGRIRETSWTSHESSPSHLLSGSSPSHLLSPLIGARTSSPPSATQQKSSPPETTEEGAYTTTPPTHQRPPQIFKNTTLYINGSTSPTISDHKLKHLISLHGGNLSISLGRRTVTHVIIGRPSSKGGCGGGLAGSKIQKEVARRGGEAVRYVTVEWVTESVKAGRRLPEGSFEGLRLVGRGTGSVARMFGKKGEEGG